MGPTEYTFDKIGVNNTNASTTMQWPSQEVVNDTVTDTKLEFILPQHLPVLIGGANLTL